jgi:hypothetical protein
MMLQLSQLFCFRMKTSKGPKNVKLPRAIITAQAYDPKLTEQTNQSEWSVVLSRNENIKRRKEHEACQRALTALIHSAKAPSKSHR